MSDLKRSNKSIAKTTHGHALRMADGSKASPTYQSWMAMKTRCTNPNRDNADRYFEAGVQICDRWMTFENFLADMGERPPGFTLDRWPNKKGNYEPGNCRWASPTDQARNTRKNVLDFDKAVQVALMRLKGVTCKQIATTFGISESLPREIVKGRCWNDALAKAKGML